MHHHRRFDRARSAPPSPPVAPDVPPLNAHPQRGLNLFLHLKSPAQMLALLATIKSVQTQIDTALKSLHYVHFARFVPTQDGSTLMVITSYDGDLRSYLMDFVAVLGDEFTAMLMFVEGAPRLPVKQYPDEFVAFVEKNNIDVNPWSAYPDMTVIEIQRADNHR